MADEQPENAEPDEDRSTYALLDVPVDVIAVLGSVMMPVSNILKLGRGAVVELDRRVNENIELFANGQAIAKGEVAINEDRLTVSITQIHRRV